jgi:hypothetical protein
MLRAELLGEVRTALMKARAENRSVVTEGIVVRDGNVIRSVWRSFLSVFFPPEFAFFWHGSGIDSPLTLLPHLRPASPRLYQSHPIRR